MTVSVFLKLQYTTDIGDSPVPCAYDQ